MSAYRQAIESTLRLEMKRYREASPRSYEKQYILSVISRLTLMLRSMNN
jgi:hypothetical protein